MLFRSVPCIGRRILNHCATREALLPNFKHGGFPEKSAEEKTRASDFIKARGWGFGTGNQEEGLGGDRRAEK